MKAFSLSEQEHAEITRALRRLMAVLEFSNPAEGPGADSRKAASAAPNSPATEKPAPRDRWTHDRSGKEIPRPDVESYSIRVWKCEKGTGKYGAFLDVRWNQKRAYCHDESLFPWIIAASQTKAEITVYLEQHNNFAKIVGVKA